MICRDAQKFCKALFAISLSFSAFAETANAYVSEEGHEYAISCNSNGYVLRSKFPVSRFIEAGAGPEIKNLNPETIYLGQNCDAHHKIFGEGKWCWANSGFAVEFKSHNFRFPRQELNCEPEPASDCPC